MQFNPLPTLNAGNLLEIYDNARNQRIQAMEANRREKARVLAGDVFTEELGRAAMDQDSRFPGINMRAYRERGAAEARGLPYNFSSGGVAGFANGGAPQPTILDSIRNAGSGPPITVADLFQASRGSPMQPGQMPTAETPQAASPTARLAGDNPPLPINREALVRLAQIDPEMALNIQSASGQARRQFLDEVASRMAIGSRVYSAVLAAPEDQRDALYQQYREEVEGAGVADLPDVWDENQARSRLRMGLTTAEALGLDMRQAAQDWSIKDDILDNDALQDWRDEQIRVRQRGQDIASRDRRRGQDRTDARLRDDPRRNAPTPNSVIGRILDKQARGAALTASETQVLREYQAGRGTRGGGRSGSPAAPAPAAGQYREGQTATNPTTGERRVYRGGRWVPAG